LTDWFTVIRHGKKLTDWFTLIRQVNDRGIGLEQDGKKLTDWFTLIRRRRRCFQYLPMTSLKR
ncbi:hypothetical protein DPMN_186767, partial [Dreissena polymorpha]